MPENPEAPTAEGATLEGATTRIVDTATFPSLEQARSAHLLQRGADLAERVLEPYRKCDPEIRSALRNFLVDFLHLTERDGGGQAIGLENLQEIAAEAVGLYSGERSAAEPSSFSMIFEVAPGGVVGGDAE